MKGERTMGKLSGKFAIVTGAAKGIGAAAVEIIRQAARIIKILVFIQCHLR